MNIFTLSDVNTIKNRDLNKRNIDLIYYANRKNVWKKSSSLCSSKIATLFNFGGLSVGANFYIFIAFRRFSVFRLGTCSMTGRTYRKPGQRIWSITSQLSSYSTLIMKRYNLAAPNWICFLRSFVNQKRTKSQGVEC